MVNFLGEEAQDNFPLLSSAIKLEWKLSDGYQKSLNHMNVSSKNKSQIHISLFFAYIYNINTNLLSKYIFFLTICKSYLAWDSNLM